MFILWALEMDTSVSHSLCSRLRKGFGFDPQKIVVQKGKLYRTTCRITSYGAVGISKPGVCALT